jgi:hypothetical protein
MTRTVLISTGNQPPQSATCSDRKDGTRLLVFDDWRKFANGEAVEVDGHSVRVLVSADNWCIVTNPEEGR